MNLSKTRNTFQPYFQDDYVNEITKLIYDHKVDLNPLISMMPKAILRVSLQLIEALFMLLCFVCSFKLLMTL